MLEKSAFEVSQSRFIFVTVTFSLLYCFLLLLGKFKTKSQILSPESREQELSFDTKFEGLSGFIVGVIGT